MTDIVKLARRLHRRIKWQEIPETLTSSDLIEMICDAIRMLYVISGRTFLFSEDKFLTALPTDETVPEEESAEEPEENPAEEIEEEPAEEPEEESEEEPEEEDADVILFEDTLAIDEIEWVLLEGEIAFYNLVLSNVDDLQSYTTDAMAVTHGDKPYKNVKSTLEDRQMKQAVVWTRMVRYNQLGVAE